MLSLSWVSCSVYGPELRDSVDARGRAGAGAQAGLEEPSAGRGGSLSESSAGSAGDRSESGGTSGADSSAGSGGLGGLDTPAEGGASGASAAGVGGVAGHGVAGGGTAGAPAVPLTQSKASKASTQQTTHESPYGNDGDTSTRWCASTGSFPQWWRVDLGAEHELSTYSVNWEYAAQTYTYRIETSSDDATYVEQTSLSGKGATQSGVFPARVSARYVRLTTTNATPSTDANGNQRPTWACFFEFGITGW